MFRGLIHRIRSANQPDTRERCAACREPIEDGVLRVTVQGIIHIHPECRALYYKERGAT